jgi:predicted nucleic acid-binding protein
MTGDTLDTNIVEDADLLMAAIALVNDNDVVLVTHNTAHFSWVTDLKVEDWLLP